MHPVDAGGHAVVLVLNQGLVYAVDGWCPHRGGPMTEAHVEGAILRCPYHGFKYDFRTGWMKWPTDIEAPPTHQDELPGHIVVHWETIPTYPTRILEDGTVELAVATAAPD